MHALTRRDVLKVLGFGTATMVLAACAPKVVKETVSVEKVVKETVIVEEAVTEAPTAAPKPAEVTTVVYISFGTSEVERIYNDYLTDNWNKNNQDIQLKTEEVSWQECMTKLTAYDAAGTPPNFSWPTAMSDFADAGKLVPLEDILGESRFEYHDFLLDPNSGLYWKDKMYQAPFCAYGRALVVRNDVWREAGFEPSEVKTWNDYLEVAKAVSKPPDMYSDLWELGLASDSVGFLAAWVHSNGLSNVHDFSNEEAYLETLEFIAQLFEHMPPAQVSWSHTEGKQAYLSGVVATYPIGTWYYGDIARIDPDIVTPERTTVVAQPHGPRLAKNRIQLGGLGYIMWAKAPNREAAGEVLRWFTQKEQVVCYPMNLAPKKGITVDDRVKALPPLYNYEPESLRAWEEGWYRVADSCDTFNPEAYLHAAEVNKIVGDQMVLLFLKQTTPAKAYEALKAGIEPLTKG